MTVFLTHLTQNNRSQPPPTLVQSQSLREQNFGDAEGKAWSAAEWHARPTGEDARTIKFADGESLEDVNARMSTAIRRFVLPRIEALRKETTPQATPIAALASATGSVVPPDVPHIVIVAHGIAIAELLRVFMSLHDNEPPGMAAAPWQDPRLTYTRVRLENTGWTRLQISVRSLAAASSPTPTSAKQPGFPQTAPGPVPPPTQRPALPPSMSIAAELEAGQVQIVEGPSDSTRTPLPPSAPTAGRHIFVRILIQNNIDHLAAGSSSAPAPGSAASVLGGGASPSQAEGADASHPQITPSTTANSIAPNNPSTPLMPVSSTLPNMSKSPARALGGAQASNKSLNAYDSRFLAREMERASGAQTLQSVGEADAAAALESGAGQSGGADGDSDAWQALCIKVLPLFNGEGLKSSFHELNGLVS